MDTLPAAPPTGARAGGALAAVRASALLANLYRDDLRVEILVLVMYGTIMWATARCISTFGRLHDSRCWNLSVIARIICKNFCAKCIYGPNACIIRPALGDEDRY
jgi:hypothetical protein